jgi:hypothetical protein
LPFKTRETVATETDASRATSRMVTLPFATALDAAFDVDFDFIGRLAG